MTVKAIDWTQGDVGHVAVALRDGTCRIDWGDGKSTPLFTYKEDCFLPITHILQDARSLKSSLR